MKIRTIYYYDAEYYRDSYSIEIDGVEEISVGTLSRDLSFAFGIVPLMKKAFDAGARGEEWTWEEESNDN